MSDPSNVIPALVRTLLVTLSFSGTPSSATPQTSLAVTNLRCEYMTNPIGIDATTPRLSWEMISSGRGVSQRARQIQVSQSADALLAEKSLIWDTGKVASDQSIHISYDGPELQSGRRYFWRVRVWGHDDQPSPWSEPAFWEMGLLAPSDWQAAWITPDAATDASTPQPSPVMRGTFTVDGTVQSARAYVTSLGLYEMEINGRRVGNQLFTPGWTSYHKRIQYQTYDITEHLQSGENAVGVTLGDGWYRGYLGWQKQRNFYGEKLALLLQVRITYADGRLALAGSGGHWKAATGPILSSDLYMGEKYDARLERPGWSRVGYDDSDWANVRVLDHRKDILVAPAGPPVRKIEEIEPVRILRTPAGKTVFDMGQNMVGWVRLKVRGAAGTTVTLRHAEVLDKEENFYTENLRSAAQKIEYTLKGGSEEVYEPHFTFQGFRYVAVEGYPGEPTLDSLTGVVIHSDMAVTGTWESSNPLLNRLQHNIRWGQKGNFLDVPTDCPQRDERMGWTGDAQVFARTAGFNMDVAGFFTKWLRDLAADQYPNGSIPFVIPDVLSRGGGGAAGSAAWADAGVIIPWTMYLSYGDRRILETQYDSMRAWVEYGRRQAGDAHLWNTGFHFGDWLAYSTTNPGYPGATTGKDLIATAFLAYSTDILQKTARVLGKAEDAAEYASLLGKVKEAFNREFVTETGRVGENTQTAYALALMFNLLPAEKRPEAARRLAADIRSQRNHLTTGFVGAPYVCHVLGKYGHLDVAYDLLTQDTYPSWLYPVRKGATTIWERWDGIKPDGSFQDPGMNSFNHYAYGAIGEWMYGVVAGIELDPEEPGYKHVLIEPRPGGGLTRVRATLRTMYGEVESAWELAGEQFHLSVRVPANSRATLRLPGAVLAQVIESGQTLRTAAGITRFYQDGDAVTVETGSGQYEFTYDATKLRN